MTALRITTFAGIVPRTDARLLPEMAAQVATNCIINSGILSPVKRKYLVYVPNKTMPAIAIYKAVYGASSAWLTWPYDVDAVKMPMPPDVTPRFAWTGDGEPRWGKSTDVTAGGGNDYPKNYFALGIPNPVAKPAVSPSGGAGTLETRFYVYTFFSQDGEESGPSPTSAGVAGYPNATWAISGMDAFPVSSGSAKVYYSTDSLAVSTTGAAGAISGATNASPIVVTETGHGRATGDKANINGVGGNTAANNSYANPYWTITVIDANTYSLDGSTGNGAYTSGGTAHKVTPHWVRAGDEVVLSANTLAVASVPSSYTFNVAGDYSAATSWARRAPWNTAGMKRRLYRTAGTASGFQLVHDDVGTTYSDTLSDAAIMGDEIISEGWKPPPVGLRGLMVTAYGALAGFVGNEYRESEPYQGHAWPDSYAYRTSPDIVAVAPMGNATCIGTVGKPYVALGSDPGTKALVGIDMPYPCLSKRSMVSDGDGALYASNLGMVRVDQSGQAVVFTEKWFTQRKWDQKSPGSMVCAVGPSRLYVTYQDGSRKSIMVFDTTVGELTENAAESDDIYVDESTGAVYISDGNGISALVGGEYPEQQTWRSKEFVLPKPANFGAAKVRFETAIDEATRDAILAEIAAVEAANAEIYATGKLKGAVNSHAVNIRKVNGSLLKTVPDLPPANNVTFTLFVDGAEKYTREATDIEPFRLPSGYLGNRVSVQVSSACDIHGIEMAETMQELAQT